MRDGLKVVVVVGTLGVVKNVGLRDGFVDPVVVLVVGNNDKQKEGLRDRLLVDVEADEGGLAEVSNIGGSDGLNDGPAVVVVFTEGTLVVGDVKVSEGTSDG